MKKSTTLNEHIDRILKVSDYKIPETKRILAETVTPISEIAPAPVQGQAAPVAQQAPQQQVNPQQGDANLEQQMDIALGQLMQALPQELQQVATTQGDRDGQLELVGQPQAPQQQQPQVTQQTQGTQPAQGTQPIAENELNEAILSVLAGGALALPAIGNLIGKTMSFLGKKTDSQTLQAMGQKVNHAAHNLHHKYESIIDKILMPLTKNANPQTRKNINTAVFYALVAVLGGVGAVGATHAVHGGNVGLAAVEGGLSTIKASELVSLAKDIVPKIFSNVVA